LFKVLMVEVPHIACYFQVGLMGLTRKEMHLFQPWKTLTCSMQLLSAYKRLPPIRCLHPNHGSCSNHRQVCLEDRCVSSLLCIQRSLLQILSHVFEPPILQKVEMISSLLACSLSKGIMPCWHQKWPYRRAMSLLKRPILLLLNKVARVVIPGVWRPFGGRTGQVDGRAALSITPYMNRARYCRQRNYCSKFTLL
jgi:hypothetical protein